MKSIKECGSIPPCVKSGTQTKAYLCAYHRQALVPAASIADPFVWQPGLASHPPPATSSWHISHDGHM